MTSSNTATIEVLTAEVRVLMLGSRQVTLSVYAQLDSVEPGEIEPWGRVRPRGDDGSYIWVIGAKAGTGELVRASAAASDAAIGRLLNKQNYELRWSDLERKAGGSQREAERYEDAVPDAQVFVAGRGYLPAETLALEARKKQEELLLAAQALRQQYAAKAAPIVKQAGELAEMPLIVLAGLR